MDPMDPTNAPNANNAITPEPDEINLLDLWRVLVKRWKMIALLFLGASVATFVISLLLPKTYQAQTTIIPLESSGTSLSSALATLGGLTGISLGQATPAEKLIAVLKSRTVTENVINKLNLFPELTRPTWLRSLIPFLSTQPTMEGAVKKLQEDYLNISSDSKSNLITVAVEHRVPERASQIANAFIEELDRFMNTNALTLSKKKRLLLERQVNETKEKVKVAEERLKDYQENKRLLAPNLQAEAAIKGLADLKAEIVSKEVELGVLRSYATPDNPEVQRLQEQVNMLKRQLAKLESGQNPGGGSDISLAAAPQLALSFERYKRDVEFYGKMLEVLLPQYEMAKIEEAKEEISFQVIDKAVPPMLKFKPKTILNTLLAGLSSLFLGIFLAFFLQYVERMRGQSLAPP
ncbi:MAG: Wzz/FepE/Etk N-terminal domain-containing protein [candidate division NC10 bacterium]|nr:Wzz/FepE/Etk N-terminal domain-containing protein [candidate division NC10 bacterium]